MKRRMVQLCRMNARPIRCLVSAGPTREFFDPVRFLSNPSSGKMGYAIAAAAAVRGWQVELVSGPVSLPPPHGVQVINVVTGNDMYAAIRDRFAACDVLFMTAAIMDYRPRSVSPQKIKKYDLAMSIEMEPVIDVLATVAANKTHQLVVGFAAETDHLEAYARRKLQTKNADFIVANCIGGEDSAFGRDDNEVVVFGRDGSVEAIGRLPKAVIATRLLDICAARLDA
jgi:phosphopantothenoylcysteine decarboxylase/phosphopantothenate--cysteine ligase